MEFAVCLPLIMIIVLGSIEAASLLFMRQALIQSAYEGVKVAIRENTDNSDVTRIANAVADGRRLQGVTVSTVPTNISNLDQGDLIRVRVEAPVANNAMFAGGFFPSRTLSAEAVMVQE